MFKFTTMVTMVVLLVSGFGFSQEKPNPMMPMPMTKVEDKDKVLLEAIRAIAQELKDLKKESTPKPTAPAPAPGSAAPDSGVSVPAGWKLGNKWPASEGENTSLYEVKLDPERDPKPEYVSEVVAYLATSTEPDRPNRTINRALVVGAGLREKHPGAIRMIDRVDKDWCVVIQGNAKDGGNDGQLLARGELARLLQLELAPYLKRLGRNVPQ